MVPKIDRFFLEKHRILFGISSAFSRWNPQVKKEYSGTVGLTSIGMFGSGTVYPVPITPMTTTIGVGSIVNKFSIKGRPN